jgi:hypothetical protein
VSRCSRCLSFHIFRLSIHFIYSDQNKKYILILTTQVTIVISYFLNGNRLIVSIMDFTRLTALLFTLLRLFTIITALFLTHFYT